MPRPNKYDYLVVVQGHYNGWEDLTQADNTVEGRRAMKADLKAYRDNAPGKYRIIKRRELR